MEKGETEAGEMKKILVRIGKKDYEVPEEAAWRGRLVMVTENPAEKGGVLVWRLGKRAGYSSLVVRDGSLSQGTIEEREEKGYAATAHYNVHAESKVGDVWHFLVSKRLRRKNVGTAMRELLLRDMRDKGARYAIFPYHEEKDFYKGRGFRAVRNPLDSVGPVRYGGKISELGIKPKGIKLEVLWKRAKPRLSR